MLWSRTLQHAPVGLRKIFVNTKNQMSLKLFTAVEVNSISHVLLT